MSAPYSPCWFRWETPGRLSPHGCIENEDHKGGHVCCCGTRTDDEWTAADGSHWVYVPAWDEWTGWMPHENGCWVLPGPAFLNLYPEAKKA